MAVLGISTSLATNGDAQSLASLMTAAFTACDTAFPLIWNGATEGTHNRVAEMALFTPVEKEDRLTFKAVDGETGKVVGFVTWVMPRMEAPMSKEEKKGGDLPEISGVNMELWKEKIEGPKSKLDSMDRTKDINLSLCFVHPDYQRRGIASLLLEWGIKKSDELGAEIWLTSTPQAISTYKKNGWKIMSMQNIDLGKYGGDGSYNRASMVRVPNANI